jgi:hypothetical protein
MMELLFVIRHVFQKQLLTLFILAPKGHFDPKRVDALFLRFQIFMSMSLFTMKHFLEVDNEVILLFNGWIWY